MMFLFNVPRVLGSMLIFQGVLVLFILKGTAFLIFDLFLGHKKLTRDASHLFCF